MAKELRLRISDEDYAILVQMAKENFVEVNQMVRIMIRKAGKPVKPVANECED